MQREQLHEMESEVGVLLADVLPRGRVWRWTFEGYAQGMLLHLMESFGFTPQFLPVLAGHNAAGDHEDIVGCRFIAINDGRTFSAYHPELGVAVVMAALMGLRARTPMGDRHLAS